jgi:hypothetical protein
MGLLAASGAKSTVSDILSNMAASADVLALAKVEVEMSAIPEGKNLIVKWRGYVAGQRSYRSARLGADQDHTHTHTHPRPLIESPFSSVTEPPMRSRRPTRSMSRVSVIPRRTTTVSNDPNGWSWSVYALTWVVYLLVRPVTVSPLSRGRCPSEQRILTNVGWLVLVDGGWFCPCHGSHYDISGRIRKGPAPVSFCPYQNFAPRAL